MKPESRVGDFQLSVLPHVILGTAKPGAWLPATQATNFPLEIEPDRSYAGILLFHLP